MGKLFGTDGVRGMANQGNMTPEMALRIGRATGMICRETAGSKRPTAVIGKDSRRSGDMLEAALIAGLNSVGVDALTLGVIPTPAVAFMAQDLGADAGIVISASHNPFFDNGIKIFGAGGCKLSDEAEAMLEDLVLGSEIDDVRPEGVEVGTVHAITDAALKYIQFCKRTIEGVSLDGMRVVIDCANGATTPVAAPIFGALGTELTVIHHTPTGININDNCGSQHTADLTAKVLAKGAQVGLAFDGDGDRLIVVDENGAEISGDQIIAIIAKAYKERGILSANKVVGTVMSNVGFHAAMKELGIETGVAGVGDRLVLEMMKRDGAVVGGESSGHILLLDLHTTGDGIISGLQLLRVMKESGLSLSELGKVMKVFPQHMINVDVKEKPSVEAIPELQAAIAKAEAELGDLGRVLIRYSGTQPMCRVMVEGPSDEITLRLTEELAAVVTACIG
jgi:phosphoglucosamine mutase